MIQRISVAVLMAVTGASLAYGQTRWHVELGGAYRTFGDVEFAPIRFRNAGNIEQGPFGVQDYLELPILFDGSGVTVDNLVGPPVDTGVDSGSSLAPFIGVDIPVASGERLELALEASLQYHAIEASFSTSRKIRGTHYNYMVLGGVVSPPPVSDGLPGFSPGLRSAQASAEFEADLFVVDCGLRVGLPAKAITFSMSAGPVLYLAQTRTEVTHSASWNPIPGADDTGFYRSRASGSGWQSAWGVYGSLGVTFELTENTAVQLGYRYDWAARDIDTEQAALQLDGHGARLSLLIAF